MRQILVPSGFLFLAACATRPTAVQPEQSLPPSPHTQGRIIGLTAEQLVERFGNPALQIREGNSWKLQFRNDRCVLDAYLYPSTAGAPYRVTYVDARTPSLGNYDETACIASLQVR